LGDQLRHLGSSYETQFKQETAICEMGFNGDLAQLNSGKPMSALGQKRTSSVYSSGSLAMFAAIRRSA
jgi:hypothetical protein